MLWQLHVNNNYQGDVYREDRHLTVYEKWRPKPGAVSLKAPTQMPRDDLTEAIREYVPDIFEYQFPPKGWMTENEALNNAIANVIDYRLGREKRVPCSAVVKQSEMTVEITNEEGYDDFSYNGYKSFITKVLNKEKGHLNEDASCGFPWNWTYKDRRAEVCDVNDFWKRAWAFFYEMNLRSKNLPESPAEIKWANNEHDMFIPATFVFIKEEVQTKQKAAQKRWRTVRACNTFMYIWALKLFGDVDIFFKRQWRESSQTSGADFSTHNLRKEFFDDIKNKWKGNINGCDTSGMEWCTIMNDYYNFVLFYAIKRGIITKQKASDMVPDEWHVFMMNSDNEWLRQAYLFVTVLGSPSVVMSNGEIAYIGYWKNGTFYIITGTNPSGSLTTTTFNTCTENNVQIASIQEVYPEHTDIRMFSCGDDHIDNAPGTKHIDNLKRYGYHMKDIQSLSKDGEVNYCGWTFSNDGIKFAKPYKAFMNLAVGKRGMENWSAMYDYIDADILDKLPGNPFRKIQLNRQMFVNYHYLTTAYEEESQFKE